MSKKIPMSAVVLAGGKSSRMGTDKALFLLAGALIFAGVRLLFKIESETSVESK